MSAALDGVAGLPDFSGRQIDVRFVSDLSISGGKLLSSAERGQPVHAATFVRRREMILEAELRSDPAELRRVAVHELFHFVWVRLSNAVRREWESVLEAERRAKISGELGWSAEWRKAELAYKDVHRRSRKWREYACESFCDTAAWMLTGGRKQERTLAPTARRARQRWLENLFVAESISI